MAAESMQVPDYEKQHMIQRAEVMQLVSTAFWTSPTSSFNSIWLQLLVVAIAT